MRRIVRVVLAVAALVAGASSLHAQVQRPRAELTPVNPSTPVRAGTTVHLSLQVKLPQDIHVQANQPKDPALIPTVLTVDAPPGVKVERITYPPATELAQVGRRDTLAVLGPEFTIAVELALTTGVAAGDLVVPARLRYQACNDAVCFPPATAVAQWNVRVETP